jgi:uncharacterized membrane protein
MDINKIPFIALIILSLPAVWSILTPGYFPMHDDTQVVRVDQMVKALRAGQFPVRFVPDLGYGYGYPIFNFYNPLPYYFGALFMLLGFDALLATKIMFIFPILLSGTTMYLLARRYFSTLAALTAALFYVYAPYHAVQIYVRGAVAEYWAYAFIPLVIYAFLAKRQLLAAIALALLILSHNLTAFMFIPLLGILFLLFANRYMLYAALLALGLAAFFWLPALTEQHLTRVPQMVQQQFNPLDHFVYPDQLWSSIWGYAGSAPGKADGLSFMIGKLHIIFTLFSLVIFVFSRKITKSTRRLTLLAISYLLFAMLMLLPLSYFIWANLPVLRFLQFPWRYLSFVALSTSILSGFAITKFPKVALLLPLFIVYSIKFFQPQFTYPITDPELLTEEQVKWVVSARSDEYLPKDFDLDGDTATNQRLVRDLLKPTPIRTASNLVSLISLGLLVLQFSHGRFSRRRGFN